MDLGVSLTGAAQLQNSSSVQEKHFYRMSDDFVV